MVANQITLFVIISLAFGTPGGGGVSAWTYAYQFFQLPYGIFTVSVMTAFTPELARLAADHQWHPFQDRFLFGFRLVTLVLLPSTVLLVILARPVVSVLLSYGHFHAADARSTASTVAGLAWGIVGFSVYLYALRGFYALRDTKTPFLINLFENALTLLLAFVFVSGFGQGVQGLAWAWSLAYLISSAVGLRLAAGADRAVRRGPGGAHHGPGVAHGGGGRGHDRGGAHRRPRVPRLGIRCLAGGAGRFGGRAGRLRRAAGADAGSGDP